MPITAPAVSVGRQIPGCPVLSAVYRRASASGVCCCVTSVGFMTRIVYCLMISTLGVRTLADPPLTTLYNFSGGSDGSAPLYKALMEIGDVLYGTTKQGGANNTGTVFKLTTKGMFT